MRRAMEATFEPVNGAAIQQDADMIRVVEASLGVLSDEEMFEVLAVMRGNNAELEVLREREREEREREGRERERERLQGEETPPPPYEEQTPNRPARADV